MAVAENKKGTEIMTILVDELKEYPEHMVKTGAKRHGQKWCHLVSDKSFDELHQFAELIGMKRWRFQGDHYDLTPVMRAKAVRYGAVEVRGEDLVERAVKP